MTFRVQSGDLNVTVSGDDHRDAALRAIEKSDAEYLGALTRVKMCHSGAPWNYIETKTLVNQAKQPGETANPKAQTAIAILEGQGWTFQAGAWVYVSEPH